MMIALALGLIIVGAGIAVFATNSLTYSTTESMGRLQENSRVAFEMLARDLREAAGNPCERDLPVYNVLKNPSALWYTDFSSTVRGYDGTTAFADTAFGTGTGQRVSGTDAIELKSAVSDGVAVVDHNPTSAQFKVNTVNHGLNPGDIAMACDFGQVAIFQVTNSQPGTNDTIVHNAGSAVSPGNCSKGLGWSNPANCDGGNGNAYAYGCYMGQWEAGACKDGKKWPAIIARMHASRWYIGTNSRGGKSLFQSNLRNNAGKVEIQNDEVAEGVEDMQVQYLVDGATSYVDAGSVSAANWTSSKVVAASVELTLSRTETRGIGGAPLQRKVKHIVTLRNRAP
ncbi:hypothetical protein GCM10027432_28840 [Lysobacter fragariae]